MTFKSQISIVIMITLLLSALLITAVAIEQKALAADCINADCNGSGEIDIDDVMLFAQYVFGGFVASPCIPCPDVLEIGKWYNVEDTSYSRFGMFTVGDSLFTFLDRWVTEDSVLIISPTNFRRINIDAWLISDTIYRGDVDYYMAVPDTGGTGGGFTNPAGGGSN